MAPRVKGGLGPFLFTVRPDGSEVPTDLLIQACPEFCLSFEECFLPPGGRP